MISLILLKLFTFSQILQGVPNFRMPLYIMLNSGDKFFPKLYLNESAHSYWHVWSVQCDV